MITRIVIAALLGAFTWSLMEYCIHRWMGHDRRFRRSLFGREHVRHHAEGDYFAPTWKKLIVGTVVALLLGTPATLLLGVTGFAWIAGLMGFYTCYEVLHRREHTHPGIGAYGRWARRHHFYHHFVDGRTNHGVTSPLWDLVFGTYRRPATIPVPPRLCMAWLRDPATGGIAPRFAPTFVMREPRGAR
ncbi:MAG: sterol desaturase family protein [Kofleriaceae bacterium]|nr:sterol desaturase family protein [Kofleriaceae bacterium]MCB9572714.1 sterol desaturase family protein [Kofleriaceae bacterium]